MKRIQGADEALVRAAGEKADANRFYSILLDARASSTADSMYDVAEKLLSSEKENAKQALDRLWTLKKNVQGDAGSGTIDLLVQHYQDKINVLRNREEHMGRVSRDSRKLLEEKRRKDSEIASVKQSITDLTREITELSTNLDKLKIREQELLLIGTQLTKELEVNETEIVNGLFEIMLPSQSAYGTGGYDDAPSAAAAQAQPQIAAQDDGLTTQQDHPVFDSHDATAALGAAVDPLSDAGDELAAARSNAALAPEEKPPYPKSVVKTTKGRIIGEYFYDGQVYKNRRHYILNSRFFLEHCEAALAHVVKNQDEVHYSDLVQMVQDAYKRITGHENLHFEISTNEVLNTKILKELWSQLKSRQFEEIERFTSRLRAKIAALGPNYHAMLYEQMERLVAM